MRVALAVLMALRDLPLWVSVLDLPEPSRKQDARPPLDGGVLRWPDRNACISLFSSCADAVSRREESHCLSYTNGGRHGIVQEVWHAKRAVFILVFKCERDEEDRLVNLNNVLLEF